MDDLEQVKEEAVEEPAIPDETSVEEENVEESKEMLPYQVGTWHGYPNFGCPQCQFLTLDGSDAVMWHIHEAHPEVSATKANEEE